MRGLIAAMIVLVGLSSAGSVRADFDAGLKAFDAGDYATTLSQWRPLAEQGNARAQYFLGIMYANGQGVSQDYREAVKWYRKAAEQGDMRGQTSLGMMYDEGQGVTQDFKEAVKWYRKAAEQGYVITQYNLGVRYAYGQGVQQDKVLAHMWYNIAGANGDRMGTNNGAIIEKSMTPAQIAEARKLAQECMARKYKGCGR